MFALSDRLRDLDELILINDSILGPVGDLGPILDRIRLQGSDVVGLTDSYDRTYHLQSYFLWFGSRACRSSVLQVFMSRYSFSSNKETVITEGELGLTRFLVENGLTTSVLYPYEEVAGAWLERVPSLLRAIEELPLPEFGRARLERSASHRERLLERTESLAASIMSGEPLNPSHAFWDVLLEDFNHPFLKRELLFMNPATVPTYFRVPDFLPRFPAGLRASIMEARRWYGGRLVPFSRPEPAASPMPPCVRGDNESKVVVSLSSSVSEAWRDAVITRHAVLGAIRDE